MSKNIKKELLLDYGEFELDDDQKDAVKTAVVEAQFEKAFDGFDKAGQNIAPKATKATTKAAEKAAAQAAHEKDVADIKKMMTPAQQATMIAYYGNKTASNPRVKYDHETTKQNLVKNTAPVRALMETHKNDYDAVYYMCTLSTHYMSLHNINEPENKIKKNAHAAFVKYFKKYQHEHGLPPATPSSAGSKTSSRTGSQAVSVVDEDEENEDDDEDEEDEEAGAGAD